MEAATPFDRQEYGALLTWLNKTVVTVRKLYEDDSEQPIRELFIALRAYYSLIVKFIEYRKIQGKQLTSGTVDSMHSIIVEMKKKFEEKPDVATTSKEYQTFLGVWKQKIEQINEKQTDNFLESFLQIFFGLNSNKTDSLVFFNVIDLDNFTLLCLQITELSDIILEQLYKTYSDPKYNKWYEQRHSSAYIGGRKLSRRRKSNAKPKSKHNKRRRSFKKSSHRRQRH